MKTLLNKYGRMALAVFVVTFIWMFLGNNLSVLTWPAFVIWACFYFIGASEDALKRDIPSSISGAIIGYLTLQGLSLIEPGLFLQAILVGFMAAGIILVQEHKWFVSVPMTFIGLNIYFAVGSLPITILLILIGSVMGLATNVLTELFELY